VDVQVWSTVGIPCKGQLERLSVDGTYLEVIQRLWTCMSTTIRWSNQFCS
jgi:hypothetical protein